MQNNNRPSEQATHENVAPSMIYDCDIVVCGVGISGIIAAVQAAENGAKVIAIEKRKVIGGNGKFTEGVFGVDSPLQKEQNIEVDRSYILHKELQVSQWLADGELWTKFLENSGPNIGWLIDHGVEFQAVSDGEGVAEYPVIHFFKNKKAAETLFPALEAKLDEYGVQVMTSTPATNLIMNDGKVCGVFAKNKDGEVLQINAKAVILATGSFANNEKYLRQRGWNLDGINVSKGVYTGDGIRMATEEAKGKSFVPYATFNATNHLGKFYFQNMFVYHALSNPGDALWVNQNAARFIYENYASENYMVQCVPALTQKKIFSVFDRAILESWADNDTVYPIEGYEPMNLEEIDNANDPALAVADTLEEAAEKMGIDPVALRTTVDRYNELCAAGVDKDFGKPAEHLKPISTAPFYIGHITSRPGVMIGGVETNVYSQVVDMERNPIEGLYAIGTDGCMLYRNIYTFDTACAGANANNVNSALMAANHATGRITAVREATGPKAATASDEIDFLITVKDTTTLVSESGAGIIRVNYGFINKGNTAKPADILTVVAQQNGAELAATTVDGSDGAIHYDVRNGGEVDAFAAFELCSQAGEVAIDFYRANDQSVAVAHASLELS